MIGKLPKLEQSEIRKSIQLGEEIITFRPWRTKDERNFLVKKASMPAKFQEDADKVKELLINDLIKPCVIDGNFDLLSMNQIKKLMLEIRKISVGEIVEGVSFKCRECGHHNDLEVEITDELAQYKPGDYTLKKINDKLSVSFKNLAHTKLSSKDSDIDFLYNVIKEIVYDGEVFIDFSKQDFEEFFDSLDLKTTKAIITCIKDSLDSFEMVGNHKCVSCKVENEIDYGEMPNFFIP